METPEGNINIWQKVEKTDADKVFSAKLMLFGEYTVICGSMALMTPLRRFSAHWDWQPPDSGHPSVPYLNDYFSYLNGNTQLQGVLDLKQMKSDLHNGLVFASDIPVGYGAGSSGALVSAVYQRYAFSVSNDTHALKHILAVMESYFHGQSSGLDPLCINLNRPLLLRSDGTIDADIHLPDTVFSDAGIFLVDTGDTGMTAPLVGFFRDQLKNLSFFRKLANVLIPATNNAIRSFIDTDTKGMFENLSVISSFQLTEMQPMIPEDFRDFWKSGMEQDLYVTKLCGSGGGGFMLGFTQNTTALDQWIKSNYPDINYFYL